VPAGLFVFLSDVDFLPTPTLHGDLAAGVWAPQLAAIRAAWAANGTRAALITPAFERLAARNAAGRLVKDAAGVPVAMPWRGPCGAGTGCEALAGVTLPRTFEALRSMLQAGGVVDVFHRAIVRARRSRALLASHQHASKCTIVDRQIA
jgi:hypothetical protein